MSGDQLSAQEVYAKLKEWPERAFRTTRAREKALTALVEAMVGFADATYNNQLRRCLQQVQGVYGGRQEEAEAFSKLLFEARRVLLCHEGAPVFREVRSLLHSGEHTKRAFGHLIKLLRDAEGSDREAAIGYAKELLDRDWPDRCRHTHLALSRDLTPLVLSVAVNTETNWTRLGEGALRHVRRLDLTWSNSANEAIRTLATQGVRHEDAYEVKYRFTLSRRMEDHLRAVFPEAKFYRLRRYGGF